MLTAEPNLLPSVQPCIEIWFLQRLETAAQQHIQELFKSIKDASQQHLQFKQVECKFPGFSLRSTSEQASQP